MIFELSLFFLLIPLLKCDKIEEGTEWNLEKKSGLFQGDIQLTSKQHADIFGTDNKPRPRRQIMFDSHWPNNTIYFEYDESLSVQAKYMFQKSIEYISARTCLKFVEDEHAENRIAFRLTSYCSSYIGMKGGVQNVNVGPSCNLMGNALHELLHALGITHSMSRYDRDEYLIINTTLFSGSDDLNYYKYTEFETWNAIPFEYGSVMTYSAKDNNEPRDQVYRETMGNRLITFYDMIALHANYECECPKALACKNGGVPNPANCSECFCPDGFGGNLCDDAPKEFSKKLMAGPEWKEFFIKFGVNGWAELEFQKTTLLIEAPKNKTIQIQVTKIEGFSCFPGRCIFNGYEVKYMGDPRIMNPLFCCEDQIGWNTTYTSKLNPSPVIVYTRANQLKFTMKYRYINQSIADLPRRNNTYDSFEYPI